MKLTKGQKAELKVMKADVDLHMGDLNLAYLNGHSVIAFVRNFQTSKMVSVAVSYFDKTESDKYRKSTGTYFAVLRLLEGELVQMPLGHLTNEAIACQLAESFGI